MWQMLKKTQNWETVTSGYGYVPFQIAFTGFDGERYVHQLAVNARLIKQKRDEIFKYGFETEIESQIYFVAPGAILGYKYV